MTDRKCVLATVGTTSFEGLVQELVSDQFLQMLQSQGYNQLLIQYGRGDFEPEEQTRHGIQIRRYRFKDSISEDLRSAELIISHAGAGTVLESLGLQKRLLIVVNQNLMDNHQLELAEEFSREGFLYWTTVDNLSSVLSTLDWSAIKRYPPGSPEKFALYMDEFLSL